MECQTKGAITMIFRYIFIGIIATLIFYVLANFFQLFFSAFVATFLGNVGSCIFGYIVQMRFTFKTNAKHKIMLLRYCILLVGIFLYGQIITHFAEIYLVAYPITTAFIAISVPLFSYPLQKFWVFSISHAKNYILL